MTESAKNKRPDTITTAEAIDLLDLPSAIQNIISETAEDEPNHQSIQMALTTTFFSSPGNLISTSELESINWEMISSLSTKEINSLIVSLRRIQEKLIICRHYYASQFSNYQVLIDRLATVEKECWISYQQRLGLFKPKKLRKSAK